LSESFSELGLREAPVVRELERFTLCVRQLFESALHALSLEVKPRRIFRRRRRRPLAALGVLERIGAATLFTPNEIDCAPMHKCQDPGRRLRTLRREGSRCAPDGQECLLHRILCEPVVAQDAKGEPESCAPDAVVELGQRDLVAACNESDQGFLGKMSELGAHRLPATRPGQR
jgi:hypothetical protein